MILGALAVRWHFAKRVRSIEGKAREIARQVDALIKSEREKSTTEYRGRTK